MDSQVALVPGQTMRACLVSRLLLLLLCILAVLGANAPASAIQAPGRDGSATYANQYAQGEMLLREHNWDACLAALKPLLQAHPANTRLLNLIGLAYTGKGLPYEGDTYFQAALNADPTFVPALKNLGINEFGLGKYKDAEEHLLSARRTAPADPITNAYLGQAAFEQHNYPRAAEFLSHAGRSTEQNASLRFELAVSWLKTRKNSAALPLLDSLPPSSLPAELQATLGVALAEADLSSAALAYLEPASRSLPAASDIGYDLALCQILARQFSQAIATLQGLINGGHETSELDNLLAEAYEGQQDTAAAVQTLRRAISIDPQDESNYLDFASLCINHQAFSDAGKVLEVALSVHPRSPRILFERGILNAMQDHFDQAESDFQQSAALAPQDNSGYLALGITYLETGNAGRAIEVLRRRIAEQPHDAHLLYLLGEALIRSGAQPVDPPYREAQRALETSVHLDPALSAAHAALGSLYLQQGQIQQAIDQLEAAKRIDPDDKSAHSHLAVAYRRLGDKEKAKEELLLLQEINARERKDPRQQVKDEEAGTHR